MSNNKVIEIKNPELKSNDLLTDLIRGSAREMLAHAIELELQDFLTKHSELLVNNNKSRIVRNGYLPERKITTGIGSIDVKLPRVRDRSDSKDKINFISNIVPKHLRRSASIEELLPLLYLKYLSSIIIWSRKLFLELAVKSFVLEKIENLFNSLETTSVSSGSAYKVI